jgi:hypothetical protein
MGEVIKDVIVGTVIDRMANTTASYEHDHEHSNSILQLEQSLEGGDDV